jgi:hypothetical protein
MKFTLTMMCLKPQTTMQKFTWSTLGYQHKIVNLIWETYGGFKAHELPANRWDDDTQEIVFSGTYPELQRKRRNITHIEQSKFEEVKTKIKSMFSISKLMRKEQQKINNITTDMEKSVGKDNGFYWDRFVQFCLMFGVLVSISDIDFESKVEKYPAN